MKEKIGQFWVGTSGYQYRHWRGGEFYPAGMNFSQELKWYATKFRIVEINNTFYRLPQPSVFAKWHQGTDRGFRFFIKGSRFVSHMKKFKDPAPALDKFFNAVAPLREKFAGSLWQTPKNFGPNADRLRAFVAEYRRHSNSPLVFEFRHPGWFTEEIAAILRHANAGFCRADAPEFSLSVNVPDTARYVYYRRHGAGGPTIGTGNYPEPALRKDAREMFELLKRGKDVFVFYNNDIGGHAPRNALRLAQLVDAQFSH